MKAFLSHSSKDSEFVRTVAEELGRQYTWIDDHEFDTGDEFIAGMEKGLSTSGCFVLFASRAALSSLYVEFEITEARTRMISGAIDRTLVFLIDASISYKDLPAWLQRFKAAPAVAPKPVARAVRRHLDEMANAQQRAVFVGRGGEIDGLNRQLLPVDGSVPPRVIALSGLPGIGRRTLANRVARDHWSLKAITEIRVEAADNLADVGVRLADRYEPYSTTAGLRSIAEIIGREEPAVLKGRIAGYLNAALSAKELPSFVDDGGLLTNDGELNDLSLQLLEVVGGQPALYASLITTRRPTRWPTGPGLSVAAVNVAPLATGETKQLVVALATRDGLTLGPDLLSALGAAAAGYPPSAYQALELVRRYGPEIAVADGNRLMASRTEPLRRYLRRLGLAAESRGLLTLLAGNSPLPAKVIGVVLQETPQAIAELLSGLIDASLVVPGMDAQYWLAEPVVDVVMREFGECTKDVYARVADALGDYLADIAGDAPRLELSRALHRAYLLADNEEDGKRAFALTADWIRVAGQMYHRRDYGRAVQYASHAKDARPKNFEARFLLARGLIKLSDFEGAGREIDGLRRLGYLRESAFLTGFLERHRGRMKEAIAAYRSAHEKGYWGLSIQRELAQCYLALGDLSEAKRHVNEAARFDASNRFVLDLQILIASREGDEATAVAKLKALESLDVPEFFHHRRSTVLAAFGNGAGALEEARQAIAAAGRPTFAMLSQVAVCEMRMNLLDAAADHLKKLEHAFPNANHDVQVGLRVQFEIATRRFEDALSMWGKLRDKSKPVHVALKRKAVQGLLAGALNDARRAELRAELEELNEKLKGVPPGALDILGAEF